jgi:hypothetical protein
MRRKKRKSTLTKPSSAVLGTEMRDDIPCIAVSQYESIEVRVVVMLGTTRWVVLLMDVMLL